jgi:pimeloyl-ACP methyl ester carboxylesterase
MYDTWTVSGSPPSSTATGSSVYNSSSPETGQYVLFVHGMGMSSDDKVYFANTAYKRLWWQGYKGRFGAFDWPCLGFTSYDTSEYNAWQSAKALSNKLADLNAAYPNNVYLFAHSQGNVVAGEALKLNNTNGNGVQAYVACQAAVSAHAYDAYTSEWTPIFGSSYDTPDDYADYPPTGETYFNGVNSGGSEANFFNTYDFALGWWVTDQRTKPDIGYNYWQTNYWEGNTQLNYPNDTYKIFAFCVQSRSFALGTTSNVGGFYNVNLPDVWGNSDPFGNNYSDHCWHSAEFLFSTLEQGEWWATLKSDLGL